MILSITELSDTMNEQNQKIIRDVIESMIPTLREESRDGGDSNFSYTQQRAMINQIWQSTVNEKYSVSSIMLRLIVIDSLYSTNAAYSYFSFEEMAQKIYDLGSKEEDAAKYFDGLVEGKQDINGLFQSNYGIRKNLEDGSKQMSLMSKYAYYALLQHPKTYPLGFPIYDSLAIDMYPKVCRKLKIQADNEIKNQNSKITIERYIEALSKLRQAIFGVGNLEYQQYDLLDAYLWRMGKLDNGNYSLLFNKEQYKRFIENINLNKKSNEDLHKSFPELVSCTTSTKKDGSETKKYKYDFNELVKHQCATMEVDDILKNIDNNEHMKELIEHWRSFYR